MKSKILIIALAFLLASPLVFAQAKKGLSKDKPTADGFIIKPKFPVKVDNIYAFTDSTIVDRVYNGKQKRHYERVYTYYFTIQSPRGIESGFQDTKILIDSMVYRFKEGDESIEFNSQIEAAPQKDFKDLTLRMTPLSREFTITYSPYNDVAEIKGDQIDFLKNYLEKNKNVLQGEDTLILNLWEKGISDSYLKQFGDMHKNLIPSERIYKDSLYTRKLDIELEDVPFHGEMKMKLEDVLGNIYTLKAEGSDFKVGTSPVYLFGLKSLATPLEGKAEGAYQIKISNRGTIREVRAEFVSEVKALANDKPFTQTAKTNMFWRILGQFNN